MDKDVFDELKAQQENREKFSKTELKDGKVEYSLTYILVDTANTFFRARHVLSRGTDLDTKTFAFPFLILKKQIMFSPANMWCFV